MSKLAVLLLSVLAGAQSGFAVPVPWRNCGHPNDVVSVQQLAASRWPIGLDGPPGPIFVVAVFDPDQGVVQKLRVASIPLNWVFVLDGPFEHARNVDGFVHLPDSWLVNGSPPLHFTTFDFNGLPDLDYQRALPIPLGPINRLEILKPLERGGRPLTLLLKAVIGRSIPALTATFSLSFDGISGFPMKPRAGVWRARLDIPGIFCMDLPLTDAPMVVVEPVPFGEFNLTREKRKLVLSWTYADDEGPLASGAMDPEILCGGEMVDAWPEYNWGTRHWTARIRECSDISIRSRLTDQVDRPF